MKVTIIHNNPWNLLYILANLQYMSGIFKQFSQLYQFKHTQVTTYITLPYNSRLIVCMYMYLDGLMQTHKLQASSFLFCLFVCTCMHICNTAPTQQTPLQNNNYAHIIPVTYTHAFQNFLTKRKQRVVINGEHSDWRNMRSGIPQSSFRPNPLVALHQQFDLLLQHFISRLFTDDCVMYRTIKSDEDSQTLQHDLDTLTKMA